MAFLFFDLVQTGFIIFAESSMTEMVIILPIFIFMSYVFTAKTVFSSAPVTHGSEPVNPERLSEELAKTPFPCGYFDLRKGIVSHNDRLSAFLKENGIPLHELEHHLINRAQGESERDQLITTAPLESKKQIIITYINQTDGDSGFFLLHSVRVSNVTEGTALLILCVDNLDDVYRSTPNKLRTDVLAGVDNMIYRWCSNHGIFVKKYCEDKYIGIIHCSGLAECIPNRFDILNELRGIQKGNKITPTLSIGVSIGSGTGEDLGHSAETAVEMAISRGGDQVVVIENETVRHYGAKKIIPRKTNRVKARIVSEHMLEAIERADKVYIVGHKAPDLDSFGAAVAASTLASGRGVETKIIIDSNDHWIERLSNKLIPPQSVAEMFIDPETALGGMTSQTLLIIVDTNRPHLVLEPDLLDKAGKIIVIDHHRRAGEIIPNVDIAYIDPYASSATELLIELFAHQRAPVVLEEWKATLMLAGIALDTKNFTVQAGAGTFEAAAYLRGEGADPLLVRDIMRDELSVFLLRVEIMHNIEIYRGKIALGICRDVVPNASELAAQTADQMLNIREVEASFVLIKYPEGVWISGRSLGSINVQNIMEKMDGGGHIMGAAAQLSEIGIDEAKDKLIRHIDEYLDRGNES
jgi:cyclic-di-AMP phosphodiesterase